MEKDDEVKGEGNSYTTEFRQYDSRIGRWSAIDPKAASFPFVSGYSAMGNNPVLMTDIYGDSIPMKFYDKNGDLSNKPSQEALDMFSSYGLNISYSSETGNAGLESVNENFSIDDAAAMQLWGDLTSTDNTNLNIPSVTFGNKLGYMGIGRDGGWEEMPIDGGVNSQGIDFKKGVRIRRDIVLIDFADFNSEGFKGGSYNNGLTSSQFGLNSLFIHEYIGHGFPNSYVDPKRGRGTGGAVDRTNDWRKANGYSSMLRLSYFKVKGLYFFGSEGSSLKGKKKDLIHSLPYFKMDKKNKERKEVNSKNLISF